MLTHSKGGLHPGRPGVYNRRMELTIRRHSPEIEADFFRLHSRENDHDWCFCAPWHLDDWCDFEKRSARENRVVRERVHAAGGHDGYILYADGEPAAWAQVFERDSLPLVARTFGLKPDPGAWALGCFFVPPRHRGKGLNRKMLDLILADLKQRGAERVEAYPRRGESLDVLDLWRGAEGMFQKAGFRVVREAERWAVMVRELN